MKTVKPTSQKFVKAAQPRRVAGVPVRSGVKAGRHYGEFGAGERGRDFGNQQFGS